MTKKHVNGECYVELNENQFDYLLKQIALAQIGIPTVADIDITTSSTSEVSYYRMKEKLKEL